MEKQNPSLSRRNAWVSPLIRDNERIAEAERHIEEAAELVAHQRKVVAEARAHGHEILGTSEILLENMTAIYEQMKRYRELLIEAVDARRVHHHMSESFVRSTWQ